MAAPLGWQQPLSRMAMMAAAAAAAARQRRRGGGQEGATGAPPAQPAIVHSPHSFQGGRDARAGQAVWWRTQAACWGGLPSD